jgi:hypothetical protein
MQFCEDFGALHRITFCFICFQYIFFSLKFNDFITFFFEVYKYISIFKKPKNYLCEIINLLLNSYLHSMNSLITE